MEKCAPVLSACMQRMKGIQDALDILNGKWKIRIMAALTFGPKRFVDLQMIIEGIGPKMLSKELQLLELNGLVRREVVDNKPVGVNYVITEYGLTLETVIKELSHWGNTHRIQVMGKV
ncbi:helix-turn-helix domain-containing protein [[Flexibacter] sp. ATCC 35208]|uniref:winged helix-turn-helix transcriptional regulator n=1 Tax=[Flexibacter] sp. ATCC 35208 TaxID=1936242 RepID=UPI0009C8491A|nr:helix-turn-helix domain-containing protein [[Flexibacter] sp. ATCC 35208]OMP76293.1 transcriptional regulator [[Flexibacter] sp. ATCC 35208]